MKLNDTACKGAKPKDKPYKLSDGGGLYLEIMPAGSKLWRLKYRFNGKENRLALGRYPDTPLKLAREKREEAKSLLAQNLDPSQAKKQAKRIARQNAEDTFEAITREWWMRQAEAWSEKHGANTLHRMEKDLFPEIGRIPIRELTPPQILDAIRKIEKRGAKELARRALQGCSAACRYAVSTGRLTSDPTHDLRGSLPRRKPGHYAALSPKDLPDFLEKLNKNEQRLYLQTRRASKLLMLTLTRTKELTEAKWSEIDLENAMWIVPAKRMKNGKEHMVPLSRQALAILRDQHKDTGENEWGWVFPNQVRPRKPMSDGAILGAIKRLGFKGKMTGHGCRSLGMSIAKETLGYPHEVPDRQLAHVPRGRNNQAYDRADFMPQRIRMMQDWADYLDRIIAKPALTLVA